MSAGLAAPVKVATDGVRRAAGLWASYLALAILVAVPLLVAEVPLGVDTLNHLARIHIRAHIARDADLAALYELRAGLIPYMGLDWVLAPLARLMPTLLAGRVFTVLLLWAMVGAVIAVQKAFTGRIGFEPLLMGLVSYNALLAWGFLNYLLGVAVALLGFAAWHGLRRSPWLLRWAVFTALATVLYLLHLLALALYGALLGAYEVFGRGNPLRTPLRQWVLLGAQFLPAVALWLLNPAVAPDAGTGLTWVLTLKPAILASPFLFSGASGGLDVGLAVFAACMFFLFRLTRVGALGWNRALAAPAAVLAVCGLVLPTTALGVWFVDLRFPLVAACLAIAALRVEPAWRTRLLPLALALAVAATAQAGSAASAMWSCDQQYRELRQALQQVPRGQALGFVLEDEERAAGVACSNLPLYLHMPQLVVIERSGYSPDFFAAVTPVTVRHGRKSDEQPIPAKSLAAGVLPPRGYVLWIHLGNKTRPVPAGWAMLHEGSFFDLMEAK